MVERTNEELGRYSKSETFQSMTEEQKQFFLSCIGESMFEGVRHCLFLFDGKTTLPDGGELEATLTVQGKQYTFIPEHFSSIGGEMEGY